MLMATPIIATAIPLSAAVVLAAIQLLLGTVIGVILTRWWRSREIACSSESELGPDLIKHILHQLNDVVNNVSKGLSEHATELEAVEDELAALPYTEHSEAHPVVRAIGRVIESNKKLKQNLNEAERKLREQSLEIESRLVEARTDPLTGLANRKAFEDELARGLAEWSQARTPFALMLLDVDQFKPINDSYGHQTGDQVLAAVARVLDDALRRPDLVSRYGGDEFAVVLPDTSPRVAMTLAEHVRATVARSEIRVQDKSFQVTVSTGVTEPIPGDTSDAVIQRADRALYSAKDAGGNCAHFNDGTGCEPVPTGSAEPLEEQVYQC